MTVAEVLDGVLEREGWPAYSNRPADRGGPTKGGITLATLEAWRRQRCRPADVEALEEDEVRRIYERRFVEEPRFHLVPDPWLRVFLVDFGIHSGPETATRALQRALGVVVDGQIGPATLGALASALASDPESLRRAVFRARVGKLVDLALGDPAVVAFRAAAPDTQLENLRGWVNRVLVLLP